MCQPEQSDRCFKKADGNNSRLRELIWLYRNLVVGTRMATNGEKWSNSRSVLKLELT